MKSTLVTVAVLAAALFAGCADLNSLPGSPQYGDTSGAVRSETERDGRISSLEAIKLDDNYKLGIGTAVGAVAGGLLGSQIGHGGTSSTIGAVAGAAAGAAAGTYAQSRLEKKDAQRITVRMITGGDVTVIQPVDARLTNGMRVRVEGSGETARVVPR